MDLIRSYGSDIDEYSSTTLCSCLYDQEFCLINFKCQYLLHKLKLTVAVHYKSSIHFMQEFECIILKSVRRGIFAIIAQDIA